MSTDFLNITDVAELFGAQSPVTVPELHLLHAVIHLPPPKAHFTIYDLALAQFWIPAVYRHRSKVGSRACL
jgi:hypothetical protein